MYEPLILYTARSVALFKRDHFGILLCNAILVFWVMENVRHRLCAVQMFKSFLLCQIQQAAERPERNFVDTRQLKVCINSLPYHIICRALTVISLSVCFFLPVFPDTVLLLYSALNPAKCLHLPSPHITYFKKIPKIRHAGLKKHMLVSVIFNRI